MRLPPAVAGTSLVVFWSSGFVGATLATRSAPFLTVLAWRTVVAAVVLGAVVALRGDRVPLRELPRQVLLGLLVQCVYLGGVFAAAGAGVPAGVSALIAALQPLLVASLAGPVLGAAPSGRQVAGLVLGAAGVVVVVAGELGASASALSYLLPACAVLGLTGGTLLESRWRPDIPVLTSLAVQSAVAAVVFSTASAVRGELVPPATAMFWTATAWLVVLSAFGGYGSYLVVVRTGGPTLASTLLLLTPPTTALWAWAMFDQMPARSAVPGVLVCAAGVALFVRGRRRAGDTLTHVRPARRKAASCPPAHQPG